MSRTMRVFSLLLVTAAVALAHTVDTVVLRASLRTENEVPPVTGVTATGSATILVHLTRDGGTITSGVVDFEVDYNVTGAAEFVGLHIHNGPAGQIAGVVIPTDLSATNSVVHSGGLGAVRRQVVVRDAALLTRLLLQPDQFYVNIHSTVNPDGMMRGQLARADVLLLRAHMSPINEVPAITDVDASGSANIAVFAVRDSPGEIVSGQVIFDVNYRFATDDGNLSGLHIHNGPFGINAGVVIQPARGVALAEGIPSRGSGNITRASAEITSGNALLALRGLFTNPAGYYANLHTASHGGGVIRGQVQNTGIVTLRAELSPANEAPPVSGLSASAPATIIAAVTRDQSGQVTSAAVAFDVNYEFPPNTEFTGLHIHQGAPGAEGDVVISSGLERTPSASGVGNILRTVNIDRNNPAALAAVNGLLANPERYYLNLHTAANPNGAVRAQLAAPAAGPPQINTGGIISATNDPRIAAASPGSIITIYGTNLLRTAAEGLGLDANSLPIAINGTEVRIGGRQAPLFYADGNQINAQVPFETEPGNVSVVVVRSGDFSPSAVLPVTPFAPGIFFNALGAAVLKNADFSFVSATNPASADDIILIFCTGLGAVTPRVPTGVFAPLGPVSLTTTNPTVTIGGQSADVLGSALTPGFVGLYQVAVRVPRSLSAGPQPVVVTVGGIRSNGPTIAVR